MSVNSHIEWTDNTWNPVTGCTKVSAGCDNCYAETLSERWRGISGHHFQNGFDLQLRPGLLKQPLLWKKPRRIFVNSMSDLFHKDIPREYIDEVFYTMVDADWHTFQVLTKRSSLMRNYINHVYQGTGCQPHIWMGVSVENADAVVRIRHLQQTNARTRFLSIEPLIGPLPPLDLSGIHWVIVGGESGAGARPMHLDWVRSLRDQCASASVSLFIKQMGAHPVGVRVRGKGGDMAEWPEDLRIRQYPEIEREVLR